MGQMVDTLQIGTECTYTILNKVLLLRISTDRCANWRTGTLISTFEFFHANINFLITFEWENIIPICIIYNIL